MSHNLWKIAFQSDKTIYIWLPRSFNLCSDQDIGEITKLLAAISNNAGNSIIYLWAHQNDYVSSMHIWEKNIKTYSSIFNQFV